MSILYYDLLKLWRSQNYRLILGLPWAFLLLMTLYYMLKVDQQHLNEKETYFMGQAYTNADPMFHWLSQTLIGLYLLLIPLQNSLMCALNLQYDQHNQGWMFLARVLPNSTKSHLSSCLSVVISLLTIHIFLGTTLALSIFLLPLLLPHLEFQSLTFNGFQLFGWVSLLGLVCIPQVILHYWLAYFCRTISKTLMMTFGLMVVTYTLWENTPYYLPVKLLSAILTKFEHQMVLGQVVDLNLDHMVLYYNLIVVCIFLVLSTFFKRK